ncbi:MAG: holo-ACP synthase [Candidatus Cloacimonetes bacterium]|nr:holo-ACP synthase [Candidatus Cloacimonadota bacterium]
MIIGIGTDLIEVSRFEKSISKPRFLEKVFTEQELELCGHKQSRVQSLAARFAAKEACMKALGTGWSEGVSFSEIEVLNNSQGAPVMVLHGTTQQRAQELGVENIHITLSHLHEIASATVILEK